MRRRDLLLGGAAMAGLAACGNSGTTTGSGAASADPSRFAGKKLTVWIMDGTNTDASAYFASLKQAFAAKTGADLDVQMQPWGSVKEKFTAAIAGGTGPDVAEIGTTWTPEFADAGALVDLTDMVKKANLSGDLVQGLVDAGTLDGKLYGFPFYAGVRSFVYNKDIFSKAGITAPPTSWAQLSEAVAKIKSSQPDVTALPVPGAAEYTVYPFIWGAGGEIATEDGGKWSAKINEAKAVEGLSYWMNLALKEGSSTAAAATWKETDYLKAFEGGKVGMFITGSWVPARIKKDVPALFDKLGSFAIPGKTSGMSPSFLGGSHLGIFNFSKNQELAFEFVKFIGTGEWAQKWGEATNFYPGQKSLLDAAMKTATELQKPFVTQFVDAGKSVLVTQYYSKIQGKQVVPTMTQAILAGKLSIQAAADAAAASMNDTFSGK